MKRRSALKNFTLALGGLVSLPAWASGWTPDSIGHTASVSVTDENLLAEIVETFIPETNTPGAKSLKVHQFALRMVNDCYGEPAQAALKQGLILTEQTAQSAYNKSFLACSAAERTQVLTQMGNSSDATAKQFVEMSKKLTIQGYMNSEYVLVNLLEYNMAPGFYHGCVSIKS
jgi:hypothetical protein